MIRGTTPTHTFTLPFSTDVIKTIEITYKQGSEVKLVKKNADCTFDGNTVTVELSQEDTFAFDEGECIRVQVRVLDNNGKVVPSNIIRRSCHECLSCEVLA